VLFLPFYVSLVIGFVGMLYFKFYLEAVAIFLLSDLMHGSKEARFAYFLFVSFFASFVCFLVLELMKKKIRHYRE